MFYTFTVVYIVNSKSERLLNYKHDDWKTFQSHILRWNLSFLFDVKKRAREEKYKEICDSILKMKSSTTKMNTKTSF